MRISTIKLAEKEMAAIALPQGLIPITAINERFCTDWKEDVFSLICSGQLSEMNRWYRSGGKEKIQTAKDALIPYDQAAFAPLYRNPGKIFCIGLNYREHAADLSEESPVGFPGSFFKPATTIIAPDEPVLLPKIANVCDGEGELAVIMGKKCKNVKQEDWLDYVAGFTVTCDMTSLDILEKNTRFLTLSKSFDTFFGLSHQLVTPDEIEDVMQLKVRTILNGEVFAENAVSNMTFTPDHLVSLLSEVMTWMPGDILSTGTPRGVHIHDGDVIEGQVDGFLPIRHPVIDLKKQ